jgi:hypothetical protein
MGFYSQDTYRDNSTVWIEAHSLLEIKTWTQKLIKAYWENDKRRMRSSTFQILQWLCHGTRIADCSLKFTSFANEDARGEYYSSRFHILVYLGSHMDDNSTPQEILDDYIDTLIHEWMHHYETCMFGHTTEHEPIFNKRVRNVTKQVLKGIRLKKPRKEVS